MNQYIGKLSKFEKVIYLIFFIFFIAYTSTLQYRPYAFSYVIKIIPILSLSLIPLLKVTGKESKFIFAGLILSAIGDVLLALEGNKYFIYGLGSFGFAHVMYILALFRDVILKRKRSFVCLIFIVYALSIGLLLLPNLNNMLIPVIIYLSLLTFVGISSVLGKSNNSIVITGVMFFMISDSIIAINSFLIKVPNSSFWIMLTYFPAQFLIVFGSSRKIAG
jgi:alkenylglycerophosphocholine hydrolase